MLDHGDQIALLQPARGHRNAASIIRPMAAAPSLNISDGYTAADPASIGPAMCLRKAFLDGMRRSSVPAHYPRRRGKRSSPNSASAHAAPARNKVPMAVRRTDDAASAGRQAPDPLGRRDAALLDLACRSTWPGRCECTSLEVGRRSRIISRSATIRSQPISRRRDALRRIGGAPGSLRRPPDRNCADDRTDCGAESEAKAPLAMPVTGPHDLCMTFTQATADPLWVLDRLTLGR